MRAAELQRPDEPVHTAQSHTTARRVQIVVLYWLFIVIYSFIYGSLLWGDTTDILVPH